jgi:hypothetical protein
MSLHVPNIDQPDCGREISKSGGHNWEVEFQKVRVLARVSEWAATHVEDWNVTVWAAAAGPWIQDPYEFSIVRMLMDRYR